jgi:RNA polymerase sigma-70 factor (ECF subfamily)
MAHRAELLNYASGIVGDRCRAEDVVQEAYLRFDAAVDSQPPDEPVGYLYRIVRNLAVDGRRQQDRETRYMVPDSGDRADQIPEDRPSPEAEAVAKGEIRALQAAMAELPERTRIALEMHRFGGCKLREIAAHLGISVGLAHALVVDGLEHCRSRLCGTR